MSRSKASPGDGYTERLSIGFTPEQMRRVEEILRVRARQGTMQYKTDLMRDALNLYLSHQDDIPGTRAAITRKLEGRLSGVEHQLQRQTEQLTTHMEQQDQLLLAISQQVQQDARQAENNMKRIENNTQRIESLAQKVQAQNDLLEKMARFLTRQRAGE